MRKKIGIGIIGTGFARKVQIPAFQNLANAEIISIASRQLKNAEDAASDFDIAHFTDDWRETVEREDVELVCITTPPDTHFEMALASIELGKHVLCEKPMAFDVAQAQKMTEAAHKKNVLALIDHELRFLNGRQKAFNLLREDKIGKIFHCKYFFNNATRGNADLPWSWWSSVESGGGTLGAIGSHVVDTFRWFLGAEIAEVFCHLHTNIKQRPDAETGEKREVTSDDEVLMILKFAESDLLEEATANVSLSMVEAGNYRNCVEFFGTKGAIRIEDNGEIFFTDISENIWQEIKVELGEVVPKTPQNGWSRGFAAFSHEIINAISAGKTEIKYAATFKDGLEVQKVLDAARKSDETGCLIKI